MNSPPPSAGRAAVSWVLAVVTVLLVVLGIAAIAGNSGAASSGSAVGGVVFLFVLALLTGSGAWAVRRGGRAVASELRARGPGAPQPGARGPGAAPDLEHHPLAGSPLAGLPLAGLPAADYTVRYRQPHSQFPLVGGPVALCLLAGSVAGLALIGSAGAGGLLLVVAFCSGLYCLLAVADLPNGIDIANGRLTVGALGVPPATRLWRRIGVPLDAVRGWELLTPAQVRQLHRRRPVRSASGRPQQYLGDLRMLGRRGVLRLVTDPGSADARFPRTVQQGYLFVSAAQAGAVWDGVVLICVRRPEALAAALERALPGRRMTAEQAVGG